MKVFRCLLPRAAGLLLIFTVLCGAVYTGVVTLAAQGLMPDRANGQTAVPGQRYTDDAHLWGRVMNLDVTTFRDENGRRLLYAGPSNLSPSSPAYEALIAERVVKLRAANPEMGDAPIPVDLVTCSGSGLDPAISPAAARYQVPRIARASGRKEAEIREIIRQCTSGRFLGLFGAETVDVRQVNRLLDGKAPLAQP